MLIQICSKYIKSDRKWREISEDTFLIKNHRLKPNNEDLRKEAESPPQCCQS